jgi:hypothetical protein
MAEMLRVGALIAGDWSIDRCYAEEYRVEAIGADWVVLRCSNRDVHLFTGDPDSLVKYTDG